MQREEQPVMATGLERIAAKARSEPKLRFGSLDPGWLLRFAAHRVGDPRIKRRFPLQRPRLVIPYGKLQSYAVL
jgi:hypothetical protein